MTLVAHKYMPGQMPTEELRATFAARQHTLDYLVSALREQAGSRTLTSYLMTGPRGSGKTTLVLMLCLRVEEDPELRAAWLPVRFPEELPAVTSLRDLLAAALQVLAEDGIPGARESWSKVESEAREGPSLDLAVAGLRAVAQSQRRRPVLFVEVRGGGKGRAAYYTVADPLFSVWYQMRYLRPQRRKIEMFVEVLRIWFETEERLDVLRSLIVHEVARGKATREMAVAAEYYAASLAGSPYALGAEEIAVKNWLAVGDLREAALTLAEFRDQGTRDALGSEVDAYTRLGHWLQDHGEPTKSVEALRAAVEREPAYMGLRLDYGVALARSGAHEAACRVFDEVVGQTGDPNLRASALLNRGVSRGLIGNREGAIADYTAVVESAGTRTDQVASALINKGVILGELGRSEEAIRVYDDVLARFGDRGEAALAEQVAWALVRRGLFKKQRGDVAGTIDDNTAALALDGISPDVRAAALASRAAARMSRGESDQALSDWLAVISDGNASSAIRLESARPALEAFWRDGDLLDQILNAMPRDLTGLDLPERSGPVRLLGSLASPGMREAWPTVWRAILRVLSPETAGQLSFFTAIAEVLERQGDLSPLDPLPPEQREFAVEVLRKFEAPTPE